MSVEDAWISIYSWLYRNPVYHQVVFALLMIASIARGSWLLHFSKASSRLGPSEKNTISTLYAHGALTFILGFVIWNMDNVFCNTLSKWKAYMEWPAAFLLEGTFFLDSLRFPFGLKFDKGHSWWHLLTASILHKYTCKTTLISNCVTTDGRCILHGDWHDL